MTQPEDEHIVTLHIDAPPDREAWSKQVAAMLSNYADAPRETLAFLARLLLADALPANGRAFLAERLNEIVAGDSADAVLDLDAFDARTGDPNQCVAVFMFRERERARLLRSGAKDDIRTRGKANKLASEHFSLTVGRIKNLCSDAHDRLVALGVTDGEIIAMFSAQASNRHSA